MPAETFKRALEAYRDGRRGPPKEVLDAWAKIDWNKRHATLAAERSPLPPKPVGNLNSADTDLLNRWINDPRTEEVWQTIHPHAPGPTSDVLIKKVISARRSAVGSANRMFGVPAEGHPNPRTRVGPPILRGYNAEWAALVPELKDRLKRIRDLLRAPPAALDPLEAAGWFEWLEYELTRTAQEFKWVAEDIRTLHRHYLGAHDQVDLPRQGSHDERARGAFIEIMIKFFREHTEQNLLEQIVVLAEIAIPGGEPDPESIARSQRRKRRKT
jgi:hypothetical protein